MFLKHIDLTTALRPSYVPNEELLFVQDNVGLYEGKLKLPNHQNGQVYLTSHRICYVDREEPRKRSVALNLKDVDKYEFYAGFIKSSAKITLFPKPSRRSAGLPRTSQNRNTSRPDIPRPASEPPSVTTASWVCTICSFSNSVPANFDPHLATYDTPLRPCLACGVKPKLAHILKAAVSNATNRSAVSAEPTGDSIPGKPELPRSQTPSDSGTPLSSSVGADPSASFQCKRCTFSNHPSLLNCEICGASLISQDRQPNQSPVRPESPGPSGFTSPGVETVDCIKLSFRGGGEKIFYERLKGAMIQRRWLLSGAPAAPKNNRLYDDANGRMSPGGDGERVKTAGIAGLEQLGLNMRRNNEIIIGSAFEDLEALMASAKDVVALAERFARQTAGANGSASPEVSALLAESASQLGMTTTKDLVGSSSTSESLYVSELSRNLAEFLTDDARGVLKRAGGIMTLVDLWAIFNRARGGVELVSPMDFEKAAQLWEKLKLPVRLRKFKSGVLVVQGRDRTDDATIKAILAWMKDLHQFPPEKDVPWDWYQFGRGVTAQDTAERFGWSIGVAEEELELAEEKGVLCREEGIEGLKFWENFIDTHEADPKDVAAWSEELRRAKEADELVAGLEDAGFL